MRIVQPDQWNPSDSIQLENAAMETIKTTQNTLVIAGPGAGKTELLAQKAGYLFATNSCTYPRKILAISFKKDAAENLRERVICRVGRDVKERFVSLTYDAFAKGILDRFRLSLPDHMIPCSDYIVNDEIIIEKAFIQSGCICDHKASSKKMFYDTLLSNVKLPLDGDDPGSDVWKKLLLGFDEHKSCLSFKMILKLAAFIIENNKKLKQAMQLTYSHVFLDEFQDTTDLQYELVKTCFLGSDSKLTAVGDNKQRIMLWAGAKKTIFCDYLREFNATEKRLIMNHRSAPRLVSLQKSMYMSLDDSNDNVICSSKWNPKDGNIDLLIVDTNTTEAKWIATDIAKKCSQGIKPNEICILCKQKPQDYVDELIKELSENNLRARIENDYQDLLKEPAVVLILSILKLAIDKKKPHEWEYTINELTFLHGIDFEANNGEKYYLLQNNLHTELALIRKSMLAVKTSEELKNLINQILDFINKDKIRAYYPTYSQGEYLNDQIDKFVKLLGNEMSSIENNWSEIIDRFEGNKSIPIMTIHKSKGLEFNSVYFVGLEDSAFWNFKKQPMEDRCAFFVALSRAKQSVTFTYCNYRHGLKYPKQSKNNINEFYSLLQQPGIANIYRIDE